MADPVGTSAAPDEGGRKPALSGSSPESVPLITVRQVPPVVVHPLRHAVLRTGRHWSAAIYPADSDPLSAHFAAVLAAGGASPGVQDAGISPQAADLEDVVVLAVGSVLPEEPDWDDPVSHEGIQAWRVRGMAVRADSRGSGLGTRILDGLLAHVRSRGGGLVWCTARIPAISLYERAGFRAIGDIADVPGLGAHQVMSVAVAGDT
jgi:ribosomal protein S18 acetylase RimI-like enzyme